MVGRMVCDVYECANVVILSHLVHPLSVTIPLFVTSIISWCRWKQVHTVCLMNKITASALNLYRAEHRQGMEFKRFLSISLQLFKRPTDNNAPISIGLGWWTQPLDFYMHGYDFATVVTVYN